MVMDVYYISLRNSMETVDDDDDDLYFIYTFASTIRICTYTSHVIVLLLDVEFASPPPLTASSIPVCSYLFWNNLGNQSSW